MMKKIYALLLVLCMVFSFSACGGNADTKEDEKNNVVNDDVDKNNDADDEKEDDTQTQASFKVTIVDEEGNPVQGVMVQVCKDICIPAMSDAEGVATMSIAIEDGHKLSVMSTPDGYEYDGEKEIPLEAGATEYTITLKTVQ